ncbi:hypothetical protein [Desulfobacterium sp. N47]|uniref:Type II secretion system protein GspE N-terminal domain-containing protein n=1 Tax=uncultured Desulfobacterium sp. TaxID=201089 RepID=E1YAJ4_9BACT|nr:hypothetical protein N47_H24100 [uncultured Desulfobacterium sp.]
MPLESKSSNTSPTNPGRLGEELVSSKLITKKQLEKALVRRTQVDMPIGSLLIKMGFVSADDVLDFLSKKFSVPHINLFSINIPYETIKNGSSHICVGDPYI